MNKPSNQGFVLMEFIVSLSIGLCLITLTTGLYISLYKTLHFNEGLTEIQENGNLALAYLTRDVRMAGFLGNIPLAELKVFEKSLLMVNECLIGLEADDSTHLLPIKIPNRHKNSDLLLIQYADSVETPIVKAQGQSIYFKKKVVFHPQTVLLISDFDKAETFRFENPKLSYVYKSDACVRPLHQIIYYVADTQRRSQTNDPIYALYRRDINAPWQNPTEIIEGIEKLEISYGLFNPDRTIHYLKASHINNWTQVKNIMVTLHLTSTENTHLCYKAQHKPSTVFGATEKSSDKKLKAKWQQIIMLRNRNL